jgi:hypothetical protein
MLQNSLQVTKTPYAHQKEENEESLDPQSPCLAM